MKFLLNLFVIILFLDNFNCQRVSILASPTTDKKGPPQPEYDGCDLGWFRYKDYKCVYIFDFEVSYDEAETYCRIAFGAQVLNITSQEERLFWSFHLIHYSNVTANVWLDRRLDKNVSGLELHDKCLVLTSKYYNNNRTVGLIVEQSCQSQGTTVCEIETNKEVASKFEAKEYNTNEDVVPNKRINYSNGTQSDLFSGTYYVLISKFKNKDFNNDFFCNGKVSFDGNMDKKCSRTYRDTDLDEKFSNYYMFTVEENDLVQIRRFDSDKLVVFEPNRYLGNFKCYEDGLTKIGKTMCERNLNFYETVSTWKIDQYKNTDYYVIRSSYQNLTMGAVEYSEGSNLSVAFGLYDAVDIKSNLDDKLLFQIIELNYTLDVQIHSIEFDRTLNQIVDMHKKQISIVDTSTILNNSPATLTHQVSSSKEMTETFSTSYGVSQSFMELFTTNNELGTGISQSDSISKSFSEVASQSVSSSLTKSISESSSDSSASQSGSSNSVGASGGGSFWGISLSASYSHGWQSSKSSSHTSSYSNDQSNTKSNTQDKSQSATNTNDVSKSKTMNVVNSSGEQHQNQTMIDERTVQGVSRTRSYSIYKTVSLPPYSSVKISSYANWIDDMTIKYNLTLKFSARSFRRLTNGEGTNSWRTMDKEFVAYLLKKNKFPGENLANNGYDYLYGRVTGFMKASIGLDSVFVAKETQLNKKI